ncbi:tRNA (adenosine(37)-N6)-threonylcarbamoyltransferase complex dimerization subunit type 1 TsaB [Nitratireductor luteus]|uniref:tRNA (adenosine(37)-N6)-threonylcarbamoyltransferase complex dimerization subunit type 1 TsaB n=1 Tax=Nitratireductor luteus TaxID=2976980 RepID=UPI0022409C61|nr:tRNA (adenosine(37)-N6)-threonylcarbamoyltransferase complex dimerization subunit type 1 TsaB [Nitratireductor luteus]
MIVLAIDTAASLCAACVYDAGKQAELGRAVLDLGKGHAEHVMPVIEEALHDAGLGFEAVEAVAVNVGPGSFTGVRVGVSAARGLALALGIPAIGINALEALAAQVREAHPGRDVVVVTGNRGESLAYARYDAAGGLVEGPLLETAADIAKRLTGDPILAGDAGDKVAGSASVDAVLASATADIVFYARLAAQNADRPKPVPLYLRGPDAKPQTAFALPLKDA